MTVPYRVVPQDALDQRLGMRLFMIRVSAVRRVGVSLWDQPGQHTRAVPAW